MVVQFDESSYQNSFHVTLSSEKSNNFLTRLPDPIFLRANEWQVGLAEISVPTRPLVHEGSFNVHYHDGNVAKFSFKTPFNFDPVSLCRAITHESDKETSRKRRSVLPQKVRVVTDLDEGRKIMDEHLRMKEEKRKRAEDAKKLEDEYLKASVDAAMNRMSHDLEKMEDEEKKERVRKTAAAAVDRFGWDLSDLIEEDRVNKYFEQRADKIVQRMTTDFDALAEAEEKEKKRVTDTAAAAVAKIADDLNRLEEEEREAKRLKLEEAERERQRAAREKEQQRVTDTAAAIVARIGDDFNRWEEDEREAKRLISEEAERKRQQEEKERRAAEEKERMEKAKREEERLKSQSDALARAKEFEKEAARIRQEEEQKAEEKRLERLAAGVNESGFAFHYHEGRVSLFIADTAISHIVLTDSLAYILGFSENTIFNATRAEYDVSVDFATPLYVHTDIIRPSIVDGTYESLLRVVPSSDNIYNVQYHPLEGNVLQYIRIMIRDANGRDVTFPSGNVVCVLAFRRHFT